MPQGKYKEAKDELGLFENVLKSVLQRIDCCSSTQLPTHRNPRLVGHHAPAPEAKREPRAGVVYKDDPQHRPALETGHP